MIRHALALLVGLALAVSVPSQSSYVLEVNRPEAGHFWAVGPMPIDTPPILVGDKGVMAYRLNTFGEHSALYGIESFAEYLPEGGLVKLEPAKGDDAQRVALFWAHPAVLDDPSAIAGSVAVAKTKAGPPTWTNVDDGEHRKRFRAIHDCGAHWVVLWFDVFARSPVVHVAGFIARKDRQLELDVPVELTFGETISFPTERHHGGTLKLQKGAIRGTVDLDRGAIYPVRFTLLCTIQPPPNYDSADTYQPERLDDLDEFALKAGADGPRYFMPKGWSGEWMGVVPPLDTEAGIALAAGAHRDWLGDHRMSDLRPWASEPAASQGGSQNSLALTWYAPLFVPIRHRPQEVHLWSSDDWAQRPVYLFDPGTPNPIVNVRQYGATVASRQIFEADLTIGGQQYPRFQTRGAVVVNRPDGRKDVRTAPDELHTADMPLIAAFLSTGDPVCRWQLDGLRAIDLAQRQVSSGWRSNGRGEGRTGLSMALSAIAMGGDAKEQVMDHLLRRLGTAIDKADSNEFPADAVSRPIELFDDRRLRCRAPAFIPYEEAQLAYHCWVLYTLTRDERALDGAYRWGLTVAATLYRSQGRWWVPYAAHQKPDGEPLTTEELLIQPTYVHPSSWTLSWSAAGLRAFLKAAQRKGAMPEHAEYLERARLAVDWIDNAGVRNVEQLHQGLIGAKPATFPVR